MTEEESSNSQAADPGESARSASRLKPDLPADTLAERVARGELPGGQYMPPAEPPVLPEPIGDVIFEEPGAPPADFLEMASEIIDEESAER